MHLFQEQEQSSEVWSWHWKIFLQKHKHHMSPKMYITLLITLRIWQFPVHIILGCKLWVRRWNAKHCSLGPCILAFLMGLAQRVICMLWEFRFSVVYLCLYKDTTVCCKYLSELPDWVFGTGPCELVLAKISQCLWAVFRAGHKSTEVARTKGTTHTTFAIRKTVPAIK